MKFKTNLSKAKGLGSAKSGHHHWIMQRFTAVMLSALTIWFLVFIFRATSSDVSNFIAETQSPWNIIGMCIFVWCSLYHGALGIQVIVEDYVSCHALQVFFIWGVKIFAIVTAIVFLFALIRLVMV